MLGEILCANRYLSGEGVKVSHVVLMGSGEPLDNYDNVIRFLKLLREEDGIRLSLRNVSLSTCGIVPKMYALAEENLPVTLCVSLHAPNDEIRRETMPIAYTWSISEIMEACRNYIRKTGRRVIFEYALSDGVNEDYNGCIHCKGHTEFKGNGVLNVTGNSRHGVYSKEYMQVKNLTLNITGAVKDGIHCKEYFLMESGTVSISNVLDDGIQVELDGLTSTGVKTDHEDEDTGNFYMLDGTLTVKNYGGEPVKADGEIKYSGGTHTFVVEDAIEAARMFDGDTTRQIFDLNGRLMPSNFPLTKGLYIEKDGGRTVKRIVR